MLLKPLLSVLSVQFQGLLTAFKAFSLYCILPLFQGNRELRDYTTRAAKHFDITH